MDHLQQPSTAPCSETAEEVHPSMNGLRLFFLGSDAACTIVMPLVKGALYIMPEMME